MSLFFNNRALDLCKESSIRLRVLKIDFFLSFSKVLAYWALILFLYKIIALINNPHRISQKQILALNITIRELQYHQHIRNTTEFSG